MTTTKGSDEAQVRALIESWTQAVRAKDIDALMAQRAPDFLLYDLAPPLLYRGADAYWKSLQEWFPTFKGPVGYDVRDLRIAAGGDVAYATALVWIGGARTSGEQTSVWVRTTLCFRKQDGRWLAAHEHVSVPFYMDGSYKAAIGLVP